MNEMTDKLLTQIRDELRTLNAKILDPPKRPDPKPRIARPGRVFSNGQIIPTDVDLVTGAGGVRWKRITIDGEPSDLWTPRDAGGLELSTNDMLARNGHVTEIPDPNTAGEG